MDMARHGGAGGYVRSYWDRSYRNRSARRVNAVRSFRRHAKSLRRPREGAAPHQTVEFARTAMAPFNIDNT